MLLVKRDIFRPFSCFKLLQDLFSRFVDCFAAVVVFLFIGRSFHAKNFESENEWLIGKRAIFWIEVWISLEKNVGKADSKVGSINVQVFLARNVNLLASWTIDFYS